MALAERVQEKLETLPTQPGVYVFRGANDVVIYVGKARSLRSRVRSYFQPGTPTCAPSSRGSRTS
ncbi:MAG: GIY-YIG nuclease family protein [Polyangiales bacterium]